MSRLSQWIELLYPVEWESQGHGTDWDMRYVYSKDDWTIGLTFNPLSRKIWIYTIYYQGQRVYHGYHDTLPGIQSAAKKALHRMIKQTMQGSAPQSY
jgi:hypothetical protein